MRYPVFIEKDNDSDFGVTVPDLPGCYSAGETLDEALLNAEEAILTHIEGMLIDNEKFSMPNSIDKHKTEYQSTDYIWALVEVDVGTLSEKIKRINITVPERILSKIDTMAVKEGENRSSFLIHAAMEYISNHSSK